MLRTRSTHAVLARSRADGRDVCVVPLHDEVAVGTLAGVLRQARVSKEEFLKAL
jgi:predicted RNA binding protein YcfA (HicA-like mRNA interferase family)